MMNTLLTISQNLSKPIDCNDSLYQLKLSQIINDNITFRELLQSALKQISIDSSAIDNLEIRLGKAETQKGDLKQTITNKDLTISELRQKLGQIGQSGLKWFHYLGGSGLILTIGVLTGLLIK